jgi:hypothetical protein
MTMNNTFCIRLRNYAFGSVAAIQGTIAPAHR